jgi:hypothetical protein
MTSSFAEVNYGASETDAPTSPDVTEKGAF